MKSELAGALREHATNMEGSPKALERLVAGVGDAQYVLLGEATHGTHEFYSLRAELTKRLVQERDFTIVAVEADWPDAYRVNRFVRGDGPDRDARGALSDFTRFPRWMWRNEVVLEFVDWLRGFNSSANDPAGFYGIDLYSLHSSMNAVLGYLEQTDPEAARTARERYSCFDSFGSDPERYGYATSFGYLPSCEDAAVEQLVQLRARRTALLTRDGLSAVDEHFFAEQNARVVKNAEHYYRAMYRGGISSWNLRDTHMADTVDALCKHLGEQRAKAKVVVWAHNSHLGDARATELGREGELNLGQLMRERHPRETFLLGFSTYEGRVTAASDWDSGAEHKRVRPALRGSYEQLCHAIGGNFSLDLREPRVRELLREERLQRAIGVVYRPDTERASHYYHTRLTQQFDLLVHVDRSSALTPLEAHEHVDADDLPETYPSGL